MPLTKERSGQLAYQMLIQKFAEEGLMLKPKEVKRQVSNGAKKMGITPSELAEFSLMVYENIYMKTVSELQKIVSDKVEE